jgi:hypothetical protein
MECANHVLAAWMVDAGLATDRRVDLRQQGGRNLDEIDAALIDRCGEAGHVPDDTATECHQQTVARGAPREQPVEDALDAGPVLLRLARWQDQDIRVRQAQSAQNRRQMMRGHGLIRHHLRIAVAKGRKRRRLAQQTLADVNRIAAFTQFDAQ